MTLYALTLNRPAHASPGVKTRAEGASGWATQEDATTALNSISPWSGMTRLNLWDDGTPTASYGDRCYTDIDVANMGQVMTKVPKFWYYRVQDATTDTWYISNNAADTVGGNAVKVHPAFISDGTTYPQFYVGAYHGYKNDTKLESKLGVPPTTNEGYANYRTYGNNRGAGWGMFTIQQWSALQLLYLVEYALECSGTAIGTGVINVGGTYWADSGITAALGNTSGHAHVTVNTVDCEVPNYRGLEGLWGNTTIAVDGLNHHYTDEKIWVADHAQATNWGGWDHPYIDTGYTFSLSFISRVDDMQYNAAYDWLFIPASGNASYFCDVSANDYYAGNSNVWAAGFEGSVPYTSWNGIFATAGRIDGNDSRRGCRLSYIG